MCANTSSSILFFSPLYSLLDCGCCWPLYSSEDQATYPLSRTGQLLYQLLGMHLSFDLMKIYFKANAYLH